ncbi:TPA: hypothetical protein ACOBEQ_002592, partial [Enterococcus faecium]
MLRVEFHKNLLFHKYSREKYKQKSGNNAHPPSCLCLFPLQTLVYDSDFSLSLFSSKSSCIP